MRLSWRGKSPPERLCAQAFGLARIRRYPLFPSPSIPHRTDKCDTSMENTPHSIWNHQCRIFRPNIPNTRQRSALHPVLTGFFLHVDTYHKTNVDIPLYGACLPLGRSLSWQPSKMRAPQNRGMEMPGWAMSWARYGLARMREQDAREEG